MLKPEKIQYPVHTKFQKNLNQSKSLQHFKTIL